MYVLYVCQACSNHGAVTVKPVLNVVVFIERWSLNTVLQNILGRHLWDITELSLDTGGP